MPQLNQSVSTLRAMAWNRGDKLKDGKYTILGVLGQGGFGITYRVGDENGRQFALKTLNDRAIAEPNFAKLHEDFMNEALRLAQFKNHPRIVKVYKLLQETIQINNSGNPLLFFRSKSSSLSLCCILMEYIEGTNLDKWVEKRGVLPEGEALRYIQQVGDALTALHQEGFLHRDVKPSNIVLRAGNSEAVLIDFGMARDFSPNHSTHTMGGTPLYAAPEQFHLIPDSPKEYTDVYGLAATLFYLLTGKHPHYNFVEYYNIPSVSNRVREAIKKGMAFEAKDRSQSVQDWFKLLPGTSAGIPQPQPVKNPTIPPFNNTSYGRIFSLLEPEPATIPPIPPTTSIYVPPKPQVSPPPPPADDLSSDKGVDYRKLRDLLKAGNWREADQETGRVMLKVAGREKEGWLDVESINNFPCTDLRTIDRLWVKYSNGRFGFSVQKRIWESVGGKPGQWDLEIYKKFCDRVGWLEMKKDNCKGYDRWKGYEDLTFSKAAPGGHLPVGWGVWRLSFGAAWGGSGGLFSRVETCKL